MTLEQYLQKKYSKSTLYSNLFLIKRFTDYYQNKAPKATFKEVLNYIEHLRKNYNLHPKTLRHCLYGVKIYFNYLLETGQRKDHPADQGSHDADGSIEALSGIGACAHGAVQPRDV